MQFLEGSLYHIYNRGNNINKIFYKHDNYLFFLKKVRKHLLPFADFLAYCLMPNHFHFLIHANDKTILTKKINGEDRNIFGEGIRTALSSYTQAINNQEGRRGSLLSQNTKAKCISDSIEDWDYPFICFNYIHQNPLKAGLVQKLEDWKYSSFRDYAGLRKGTLCNQSLARELIGYDETNFINQSYQVINEEVIENMLRR